LSHPNITGVDVYLWFSLCLGIEIATITTTTTIKNITLTITIAIISLCVSFPILKKNIIDI
jgi:hypothetical protein